MTTVSVRHINQSQPALLKRLWISPDNWLTLGKNFRKLFHGAVGRGDTTHRLLSLSRR